MRRIARLRRGMVIELISGIIVLSSVAILSCNQRSGTKDVFAPGLSYPIIVTANDQFVPADAKRGYKTDAAILSLRIMHEVGGLLDEQVEIPQDLFNTIYSALIHVYNSRLPARDTIVDRCEVHIYCFYEPYLLNLDVDTSYEWVKAWREGKRLTGNPEVDRLMEQYDLQFIDYWEAPWGIVYVNLRSIKPLNMSVLATIFSNIQGVKGAWPEGGCIGDGDDITAEVERDTWELEYSIGWGDCFNGCLGRRFWTFQIHSTGRVEFVGSYGDPLECWCGCG